MRFRGLSVLRYGDLDRLRSTSGGILGISRRTDRLGLCLINDVLVFSVRQNLGLSFGGSRRFNNGRSHVSSLLLHTLSQIKIVESSGRRIGLQQSDASMHVLVCPADMPACPNANESGFQ